jgi:hypothetical protein
MLDRHPGANLAGVHIIPTNNILLDAGQVHAGMTILCHPGANLAGVHIIPKQ